MLRSSFCATDIVHTGACTLSNFPDRECVKILHSLGRSSKSYLMGFVLNDWVSSLFSHTDLSLTIFKNESLRGNQGHNTISAF